MIIGHGLIAAAFTSYRDDPEVTIFASGVSNSGEQREECYHREKSLLEKTLNALNHELLVYFSSYSVLMKETRYTAHKLEMEALIQSSGIRHYIIRTTHVVGPTGNPYTLLNFITERVKNGATVLLQHQSHRNLLDVDDLIKITNHIIHLPFDTSQIYTIGYPHSYLMSEIMAAVEEHYQKKAHLELVDSSEKKISTFYCPDQVEGFYIKNREEYLSHLLQKYYPVHSWK